jgi:hypothetical protein
MVEDSPAAISAIAEDARGRLAELAPYLEEASLLRRVLELLEPGGSALPPVPVLEPAHVPASKAKILTIIGEHPGITAAEIAGRYGMKRPVVASSISRLKRSGEVIYRGGGLSLAGPTPESLRT